MFPNKDKIHGVSLILFSLCNGITCVAKKDRTKKDYEKLRDHELDIEVQGWKGQMEDEVEVVERTVFEKDLCSTKEFTYLWLNYVLRIER